MFRKNKIQKTSIRINDSTTGEAIEAKIRRMLNNKEPLGDETTPLIYTDRNDGVVAAYNIRHDKWETAVQAMDAVAKSYIAKRQAPTKDGTKELGEAAKEGMTKEESKA